MPSPSELAVVFDLDDTLYKEREFVRSGFYQVSKFIQGSCGFDCFENLMQMFREGKNPIEWAATRFGLSESIQDMVKIYRYHLPDLTLDPAIKQAVALLKSQCKAIGVLTDGRSLTQRNKLLSLGLIDVIDLLVISDEIGSTKPSIRNYQLFEDVFGTSNLVYVGDNFTKDFVTANQRGWLTIGVRDDGTNVHRQDWNLAPEFLPRYVIDHTSGVPDLLRRLASGQSMQAYLVGGHT
jgi:putative hydrolase of the HAD superfamily